MAHVDAVGHIGLRPLHQIKNIAHQVQLGLAGLAPGHVQLEAQALQLLVGLLHFGILRPPFLRTHPGICAHGTILSKRDTNGVRFCIFVSVYSIPAAASRVSLSDLFFPCPTWTGGRRAAPQRKERSKKTFPFFENRAKMLENGRK